MNRNQVYSLVLLLFPLVGIGCQKSDSKLQPTLESARVDDVTIPISSEESSDPIPLTSRITVSVSIEGVEQGKGKCRIAVYSDKASFNKPDQAQFKIVLEEGTESCQFELDPTLFSDRSLAIAVYQDANGNGKLDKNSFGIPTEIYGFSGNPKRGFGPPKFEETVLAIESESVEATIHIH